MEALTTVTSPVSHGTLVCLLVTFLQVAGDQFTTVEFSLPSSAKREVVLHPEELSVQLTLGSGEVVELALQRQKELDLSKIPVYVDGEEWTEDLEAKRTYVGFYHDPDNTAALSVTAQLQDNGNIKRTLMGTALLANQAYEVHPVTSHSTEVTEYLVQRGLDKQQAAKLHLLKEVDLEALLHRLNSRGDTSTKTHNLTRDFQKKEKFESSNDSKSAKGSKTGQYQRMASDWQIDFQVQIQFLIDNSVYKFWRAVSGNMYNHHDAIHEIKYYYAHIFNGMRLAYKKILFYHLDLWLTNITIFTTDMGYLESGYLISNTAFNFIAGYILDQGRDWRYPDHVMLWTKNDLRNSEKDPILGSSYLCGVCDPGYQVSVSMDEGFFGWVTGAHELGHNLGASHDSPDINGCPANDNEIYIMAAIAYALTSENIQYALSFSYCSEAEIYDCITGNSNTWDEEFPRVCVYNRVCEHQEGVHHLEDLPGQKFDLDTQCRMLLGEQAHFSEKCMKDVTDICKKMICDLGNHCNISHSIEFRAAPGTSCGLGDEVCFQGMCTSSSAIQYVHEVDASCETITVDISEDCSNTEYGFHFYNDYFTCVEIAAMIPWKCFTSDEVKAGCSRSCMDYGLFKDNDPLCAITIVEATPAPVITTPAPPSSPPNPPISPGYPDGLDIVFCDTDISELGGVRCPSDMSNCVPMVWMCDGVKDCLAWEDEEVTFCQKVPCPAEGYVRCREQPSLCILESWLCDGTAQCPDQSDESSTWCQDALSYCYTVFGSEYKGYNCPNEPSACVPHVWTCDGIDDCLPDVKELGDESRDFCDSLCSLGQVRCPTASFKCIPTEYACDGQRDCDEESDEDIVWCRTIPDRHCYPGYVNCPSLKYRCILETAMCDGINDCYDNSDESLPYCPTKKHQLTPTETLLDWINNRKELHSEPFAHYEKDDTLTDKKKDNRNPRGGSDAGPGQLTKKGTDSDHVQLLDMQYLRKSASVPIKKPYLVPENPEILDLEDVRRKLYRNR